MELPSKVAVAGILIALGGVGAGFGLAALTQPRGARVETPTASTVVQVERGAARDARSEHDREALAMVTTRRLPEARPEPEPRPITPDHVRAPSEDGRTAHAPTVRRVAVGTGVSAREPIGVAERFDREEERLFAFVELANEGEATRVVVTFEPETPSREAHLTGLVELEVPGSVRRHRTWAWSRNVHAPGRWSAVVRDLDGRELARAPFVVE